MKLTNKFQFYQVRFKLRLYLHKDCVFFSFNSIKYDLNQAYEQLEPLLSWFQFYQVRFKPFPIRYSCPFGLFQFYQVRFKPFVPNNILQSFSKFQFYQVRFKPPSPSDRRMTLNRFQFYQVRFKQPDSLLPEP